MKRKNMLSNQNSPQSWMPEQIGNFRILSRLGTGGMGDVYKAIQDPLNRIVALKVLSPQLGRNEEFSRRFDIEAQAISRLQHQNIVNMYEYGEEQGMKFFAMQFVEGKALSDIIAHKKPIALTDILEYSRQICRGLRYAHSKNVIHRDIKPQNVLMDGSICLLSDFGIARIFEQTNITMTGMAVGTPEYMSPEQAEGGSLDGRTDIYSLGVVMYEMLTKRPPFSGNNPVAIAYKQVHEIPQPPSVFRRDTPKRLELIILKTLKKNRDERYASVEELLHDLDSVDIDEKVDRPTVSFNAHTTRHRDTGQQRRYEEKRITDRRSGDRRHTNAGFYSPLHGSFWAELFRTQGLSLFLIAILAAILTFHLYYHP